MATISAYNVTGTVTGVGGGNHTVTIYAPDIGTAKVIATSKHSMAVSNIVAAPDGGDSSFKPTTVPSTKDLGVQHDNIPTPNAQGGSSQSWPDFQSNVMTNLATKAAGGK